MPSTIATNIDFAKIVAELPPAPKILAEIATELGGGGADIDDLTRTMRHDPALSAGIVGLGNTHDFAGAEPLQSFDEAVARFGLQGTFRLAGAITAAAITTDSLPLYGIAQERLRANALLTGLVMEQLAPAADLDPYQAYCTGLLRSIGKVVLNRYVCRTTQVSFDLSDEHILGDWETNTFGYASNDIGADVLAEWGYPETVVEAVRSHYTPGIGAQPLTLLLNVAAAWTHTLGAGLPGEDSYWEFADAHAAALTIDSQRGERAIERGQRNHDALRHALEAKAAAPLRRI